MLFNSLDFFIFFVVVYGLYQLRNRKWQNFMLLAASYVFYASWDWRFLSLIWFSTILDYFCGKKIDESQNLQIRKKFLIVSLMGNLIVLGFFKYFNFFLTNLHEIFTFIGFNTSLKTLNIILPLGISFYTFQTMSYTIDIYRKEMKATKSFWDFALFVAFFPQLIAGPIERAKHLLPQIEKKRVLSLDDFFGGVHLIFYGLFQKMFIADNLAKIVDPVFTNTGPQNGAAVLVAMYAFNFQIFCDFAGYSNIARGLGKMMGFEIMVNFNLPFFAPNVQEFWNKWHISLSSWIRDYLYVPLFRSLTYVQGNLRVYYSLLISMVVIGLWHGASWHFVAFGLYYGFMLVAFIVLRAKLVQHINPKSIIGQKIWFLIRIVFMFHITALGMLLFRAQSLSQVRTMLLDILNHFSLNVQVFNYGINFMLIVFPLLLIQISQFLRQDQMVLYKQNIVLKSFVYAFMAYLILGWGVMSAQEFVYFQF